MRRLIPLALLIVCTHAAPSLAWRADVENTPPDARPFGLAVDATGNVIAGGRTPSGTGTSDGVVVRYDASDGARRWQQEIVGDGGGNDNVRGVLADASGNAIVLGQVFNEETRGDGLIVKLHAQTGQEVWRREIEGGRNGNDDVRAGTLLAGGDIIAVGVSPSSDEDVITVWRIATSNGDVLWRQTLPGAAGVAQRVVAGAGRVYVASHVPTEDGGTTITLARLQDDDGDIDWTDVLPDTGHVGDLVTGLGFSGSQVIVAAELYGSSTAPDFVVSGIAATAGNEVWRRILDGTATDTGDRDGARALAMTQNGDAVVAGVLSNALTQDDLVVARFRSGDGQELWRRDYAGTATGSDDARDVAVDAAGDVLVAGRFRNQDTNGDFVVLKLFGLSGDLVWQHVLNGADDQSDIAFHVVPDATGNVAAAGRLRNGPTADGFVVTRLAGPSGGSWPCGNHALDPGEACDDANPVFGDGCRTDCTVEVCGDARLDPDEECDDGNTSDGDCCSSLCVVRPDDAVCDDGNVCTERDRCDAGLCVGQVEVQCPTPAPCYTATCDPESGGCVTSKQRDGTRCTDGNACTVADRCADGACISGPAPFCDDGDPCTQDSCDSEAGCVYPPLEGVDGLTCIFEQRTIQFECRDPLPTALASHLEKAEVLVGVAANEIRPKVVRRSLKRAAAYAKKAERFARTRRDRGLLPFRCAQAIVTAMDELRERIGVVRRDLR